VPGGLSEIEPISDVANRDNKELCRRFSGAATVDETEAVERACTLVTGDCHFLKVVRGDRVRVPLIGKSQKVAEKFQLQNYSSSDARNKQHLAKTEKR
jgi:hypothetical protein